MPGDYYVTVDDALSIEELVGEMLFDIGELLDFMDAEELSSTLWSVAARGEFLKKCTLVVRYLNLDIACYPLSESAVVFYPELP